MSQNYFVFLIFSFEVILLRGELWEKDLSSEMKIGLSTSGYNSVDLRCGSDYFSVNVTMDEDFSGVVYTRGSFNEKALPCFKSHRHKIRTDGKKCLIGLRIPFNKCGTVMDVAESRYTNTLVIQHDPDLIMPGDAAFSLDCAFVPEFKTNPDLKALDFKSRITLVDADPAEKSSKSGEPAITVLSQSDDVTFVPNSGASKDEL